MIRPPLSQRALSALAVCAALVQSAPAATISTIGVYDEATRTNAVDTIADDTNPGDGIGTGVAVSPGDALATFTSAVATAYNSNRGGVAGFDSFPASTSLGTSLQFVYGVSGTKTLNVTSSEALRAAGYGSATAISGDRVLDNGDGADSTFDLAFGSITGGEVNERVTQVAITALSRSGSTSGGMTLTVTFDDNSTSTLTSFIGSTNGGDDTFYRFLAPTGRYITELSFLRNAGGTRPFDDFAFITGIIPEPASLALAALGGLMMVARPRKRG